MRNLDYFIYGMMVTVFFVLLGWRVEKLVAVQELQLSGYEQIVFVDRMKFAAQFRSDCSFVEYARLTFNAKHKEMKQAETVSVCIGLWGEPTIHTIHTP